MIMDCPLLLLHLCCYIIAYYTKMLTLNLENCSRSFQNQWHQSTRDKYVKEKKPNVRNDSHLLLCFVMTFRRRCNNALNIIINKNIQTYEQICKLSSELQCFFSFPILFILITKFITVIGQSFAFLFIKLSQSSALGDVNFISFLSSTTEWIRILIILFSADMPTHQVRLLKLKSTFYIMKYY